MCVYASKTKKIFSCFRLVLIRLHFAIMDSITTEILHCEEEKHRLESDVCDSAAVHGFVSDMYIVEII